MNLWELSATYSLRTHLAVPLLRKLLAMVRKSWSFKDDRRLLELAKSEKALEQIAKAMDRSPARIRKRAMRLGVSIKSIPATRKKRA
jgi:hypothetical protein